MLPALLGTSNTGRTAVVEQSGMRLAIRQGRWKYIAPSQGPRIQLNTNTELGNDPEPQLYDLSRDPGERTNLAAAQPERVRELSALLETIRAPRVQPARVGRPNIVLAIADDWSFPHAGIYGDTTVRTPTIDRLAREGARFTHAFVASPSCTPSRAALLTGQAVHRLQEGGNLWSFLPRQHAVYPSARSGRLCRGFSGRAGGQGVSRPAAAEKPRGAGVQEFRRLHERREKGVLQFLSDQRSRTGRYEPGSGAKSGLTAESVRVPDTCPTRSRSQRLLDYYFEVQRFDRDIGQIIEALERTGELDNTIIIVTSDNGMPSPGPRRTSMTPVHECLLIRGPGVVKPGTVIDALAASRIWRLLLEARERHRSTRRRAQPAAVLRGESQRAAIVLRRARNAQAKRQERRSHLSGQGEFRTKAIVYPQRRPDRWPAGDPQQYVAVGPFGDIDGGPSKSVLLDRRSDRAIAPFFELATAKRQAEELYRLAPRSGSAEERRRAACAPRGAAPLRKELDRWLRATGDPRAIADDDRGIVPVLGQPAK